MGIATLYGIRNCDTVKKARAWLDEQGVEYRFHDYKVRLIVGFKPQLYKSLQ
jgi:arsenate reductase-like glutaredoxin family protein